MKKLLLFSLLLFSCQQSNTPNLKELYTAFDNRDITSIQKILKNTSPNDFKNNNLLHRAARTGNIEIVKLIWNYGIRDINQQEKEYGWTPLMYADDPKIVQFLLDNGADPSTPDKDGDTALSRSILPVSKMQDERDQRNQVFRILINYSTNINSHEKKLEKRTPLLTSVSCNNDEVFLSLLEHGAEIDAVDSKGRDALFYIFAYTDNKVILDYLLDHGFSLNQRTTLLHAASMGMVIGVTRDEREKAKLEFIQYAMDKGLKKYLNTPNDAGNTPLHIAAELNLPLIVNYYLALGAKTDVKNKRGQTPLDFAIERDAQETIKILSLL